MNKDMYVYMQNEVMRMAREILSSDIEAMIVAIDNAHCVGPMIDPTLYHRGLDALGSIERIARILLKAQSEIKIEAQKNIDRAMKSSPR